jgi:4-amino-4-deoxy-L-arabinose transferase-like glycosyltransferase
MSATGGTPPAPAHGASAGAASRYLAPAVLALLAAGLLVLGILFRPAGGLQGTYFILDTEGKEVLVHRRIDQRLDFPVPQRLQAAYLFHWNLRRHGFPSAAPPCLVRWSGFLLAPREGTYRFLLEARGEASLRLDGEPVGIAQGAPAGAVSDAPVEIPEAFVAVVADAPVERRLAAGWHPIEVAYTQTREEPHLILRWQPPGGRLEVIPADRLGVDPAAHGRAASRRASGWALLALGAAAALLVAWRARRAGGIAARVVTWVLVERTRLALAGIVILAGLLRLDDYALVPFHHETADEYQHAWEGWHLLNHGYPASWSTFPDRYPTRQVEEFRWFGDPYALVRPYFDHPPLFSIPVGLVASLAGAESFTDCTLPMMRLVPIALSLAGIFLLYRLALLYGASGRGALLAALVYAVLPVIVLSHRLVKAENLLAPLFMGAVLLAERHARSGKARDAALLGVLCGLSIWTKATGVAVVATAVVLLLSRRRWRGTALALLVTAGIGLLYLAYAWAYDFGIFMQVVQAQATTKWIGLDSFLDLLQGKVVGKTFGRGSYLWLLLCAGVAAFRKERALLLPLAIYATVIALTADQRVIFGWYRIPLYPFLCVAAGIYLDEMIEAADLPRVFPFAATAVVTGLLTAFHGLPFAALRALTDRTLPPESILWTKGVVLIFLIGFFVPYLLRLAHERPATVKLTLGATHLLVILWIFTSVATVGRLLEVYSATRGIQ